MKKNHQNPNSYVPPKKEHKAKISAIDKEPIVLTNVSGLKDPVVITIASQNRSEKLILHRKVGKSALSDVNWVLTPVSEIQELLANAKDPSANKKALVSKETKINAGIRLGFYNKDPKSNVLCYSNGVTFQQASLDAKASMEAEKARAYGLYQAERALAGKPVKKNWKFGMNVNHFYSDEIKAIEEKLKLALSTDTEYKQAMAKLTGDDYITMAGPYSDRPQMAISTQREYTDDQLVDAVKHHLMNSMGGTRNFPAKPNKDLLKAMASADTSQTDSLLNAVVSEIFSITAVNPVRLDAPDKGP